MPTVAKSAETVTGQLTMPPEVQTLPPPRISSETARPTEAMLVEQKAFVTEEAKRWATRQQRGMGPNPLQVFADDKSALLLLR